jgi:hypothetical protein
VRSDEKYNPITNACATFADICITGGKFDSEVIDYVIFAIGGCDEITNMKHVEYSAEKNKYMVYT